MSSGVASLLGSKQNLGNFTGSTMNVPDGFAIVSAGSIDLTAGGTNENITLTPSGTGGVSLAGNVGVGSQPNDTIALTIGDPDVSSGVNSFGAYGASTASSSVTGTLVQFNSNPRTAAAAFVLGTLAHFSVSTTSVGAGSSITEMSGFRVTPGMTQATTNYGFRGQLAASGTSRYNLYMDGTAQNYLAGVTGIGVTPSSSSCLALAAGTTAVSSMRVPHGAAPTSPVDGDMWTTTAGLFVRINGSTVGPLS